MIPSDLETLREIFKDKRTWIVVGQVLSLEFAKDASVLRAKCKTLSGKEDDHKVIARVTWDGVGPESGTFSPISVGDLVLMAYAEGTEDDAYIIRRLSSREDKIHPKAKENHSVMQALPGKKAYVGSNTRINLYKGGGTDPTEALVLGTTNLQFMIEFFDMWLNAPYAGVCAVGETFLSDYIRQNMLLLKQKYLVDNNTNIVSQLAFTERKGT